LVVVVRGRVIVVCSSVVVWNVSVILFIFIVLCLDARCAGKPVCLYLFQGSRPFEARKPLSVPSGIRHKPLRIHEMVWGTFWLRAPRLCGPGNLSGTLMPIRASYLHGCGQKWLRHKSFATGQFGKKEYCQFRHVKSTNMQAVCRLALQRQDPSLVKSPLE
jgi:hypothetical protein